MYPFSEPWVISKGSNIPFSHTFLSWDYMGRTFSAPSQLELDTRWTIWASVWVKRDNCGTLLTSHPCDIIIASMLTPNILNDSIMSLYIHQIKYKIKMKCRFSSCLFQEQIKDISWCDPDIMPDWIPQCCPDGQGESIVQRCSFSAIVIYHPQCQDW